MNEIFDAEDIGYFTEVLLAYSRTGKIKNVYEGLFVLAEVNITAEDIINYKYCMHNGLVIGYWFGKSFTHHLGLIEKPDEFNIVSNNVTGTRGNRGCSQQSVLGDKIIVRNPIAAITEENYKILSVIDYVTTFRRAFYNDEYIDVSTDVEALRKYTEGLPREAFKEYEDLCGSKKLLNEWLDKIYGGI